jgi:hypothetical protein
MTSLGLWILSMVRHASDCDVSQVSTLSWVNWSMDGLRDNKVSQYLTLLPGIRLNISHSSWVNRSFVHTQ